MYVMNEGSSSRLAIRVLTIVHGCINKEEEEQE
jgi:hypothetical protein